MASPSLHRKQSIRSRRARVLVTRSVSEGSRHSAKSLAGDSGYLRKCAVFTDRFPGSTSQSLRRERFAHDTLRKRREVPPRHRNTAHCFSTLS